MTDEGSDGRAAETVAIIVLVGAPLLAIGAITWISWRLSSYDPEPALARLANDRALQIARTGDSGDLEDLRVFNELLAVPEVALRLTVAGEDICSVINCGQVETAKVRAYASVALDYRKDLIDRSEATWTRWLSILAIAISGLALLPSLVGLYSRFARRRADHSNR